MGDVLLSHPYSPIYTFTIPRIASILYGRHVALIKGAARWIMARNTRSPSRSLGLAAQTGWIGAVARFWEKTYAADYLGFALLLTAYILLVTFVEPFHRMFFISNINIQYPHALKERVPVTWGIFYGSVVPLICLVIWLGVSRAGVHQERRRSSPSRSNLSMQAGDRNT